MIDTKIKNIEEVLLQSESRLWWNMEIDKGKKLYDEVN